MRDRNCKCLLVVGALVWMVVPAVHSEVQFYHDEAAFLAALTTMGYAVATEDFEDPAIWGQVQPDGNPAAGETAPNVTHAGMTWTGFGGGVAVEPVTYVVVKPHGTGSWQLISSPHGYPADGVNGTATQTMYAVGGWVRSGGNGGVPIDVEMMIDNDPNKILGTQGQGVSSTPTFFGAIDPNGITTFEFHTEAVQPPDAGKQIFLDDFTFGYATAPPAGTTGTQWINPAGGLYALGTNWDTGLPPDPNGNAICNLGSATPYTIILDQATTTGQLVVRQDRTAIDLGGNTLTLKRDNVAKESLIVAEVAGETGELTVSNGTISGANAAISHAAGTTGTLTADAGASIAFSNRLRVGSGGTGMLDIRNGAQVSASWGVAGEFGGSGTINVDGPGSALDVFPFTPGGGLIELGIAGTGTLNVSNGGHVSTLGVTAADVQGTSLPGDPNRVGSAAINLSDPNTLLDASTSIQVGLFGPASMSVTNGAAASSFSLSVGLGADATALLDGPGSRIDLASTNPFNDGTLSVGTGDQVGSFFGSAAVYKTSSMTVSNGATLNSDLAYIGETRTGIGTLTITDPGTSWTNTRDYAYIGYEGDGTLNILNGAHVQTGQTVIGRFGINGGNFYGVVLDGVANLDGPTTTWDATFTYVGLNNDIGYYDSLFYTRGTLNVTGGATMTTSSLNIGTRQNSNGIVNVSDTGSSLTDQLGVTLGFPGIVRAGSRASLNISNGATVTTAGSTTVYFGTITLDGGTFSTTSVDMQGTVAADPNNPDPNLPPVLAGSGLVFGDINNNGGVVAPGNPVGQLQIAGKYTADPNGINAAVLQIDLAGTTPGSGYDQLAVSGVASLAGRLEISVDPNFVPPSGAAFDILTASLVTGTFDSVAGTDLGGGKSLMVDYSDPTRVTLFVVGGVPGDVDGDGHVNVTDLGALLAAFGTCTGDAGFNPAADFDGNGCVDVSDLGVLLANFGA